MIPKQCDTKSFTVLKNDEKIYEQPTNLKPPLDPIPPPYPSIDTLNSALVLRKSILRYSTEPDSESECDSEIEAVFQQSTNLPPPLDFPVENPASPHNPYITEEYTANALFEDFRKPSKLQPIVEFPLSETLAVLQIQTRFATVVPSRLRKRYIHPNAGLVDEPRTDEEVLFIDGLPKQ